MNDAAYPCKPASMILGRHQGSFMCLQGCSLLGFCLLSHDQLDYKHGSGE